MITAEQLIKKVRMCKTIQQENAVILTELSAIRTNMKERDSPYVSRNVAKIIYASMNNFSVSWGDMEIVKLLQASKNHKEKRLAYLALQLVPHDNTSYLNMATNSIKQDLDSGSQIRASLAIQALSTAYTPEMLAELSQSILKLTLHKDSVYLRKKALALSVHVIQNCEEISESFIEPCLLALDEKTNMNVLLSGIYLAQTLIQMNPEASQQISTKLMPLCKKLEELNINSDPQNTWQQINNPQLQCNILLLVHQILQNSSSLSNEEFDQVTLSLDKIVSSTHKKTESVVGRTAIQFQAAAVILQFPESLIQTETEQEQTQKEQLQDLKATAIETLTAALDHKNFTIRYSALNKLTYIIKLTNQTNGVQKYRNIVLNCMTEENIVIRQKALELLVLVADEESSQELCENLLQLITLDQENINSQFSLLDKSKINGDISQQIINSVSFIIENYVQNPEVQFRLLWQCCQLSSYQQQNIELIRLVTQLCQSGKEANVKEFILQIWQTLKLFKEYPIKIDNLTLQLAGLFCIGEACQYLENIEEVIQYLVDLVNDDQQPNQVLRYATSCICKIGVKNAKVKNICIQILQQLSISPDNEISQRALEYMMMINHPKAALLLAPPTVKKQERKRIEVNSYKKKLVVLKKPVEEPQPVQQQQPITENKISNENINVIANQVEQKQEVIQQAPKQNVLLQPAKPVLKTLKPLQKINVNIPQPTQQQPAEQKQLDIFSQPVQSTQPVQPVQQPAQQTAKVDSLDDLFGSQPVQQPVQQQQTADSLFDLTTMTQPQQPVQQQVQQPQIKQVKILKQIYVDNNVTITLQLQGDEYKLEGQVIASTLIKEPIRIKMQYAVPPSCKLINKAASSEELTPTNMRINQQIEIQGQALGLKVKKRKKKQLLYKTQCNMLNDFSLQNVNSVFR